MSDGPVHCASKLDVLRQLTIPRPPAMSYVYGAALTAAQYCGFKSVPGELTGHWKHGWAPKHFQCHPDAVIGFNTFERKDEQYWVARKDEESYLRALGFRNTAAIGLPLIYASEADFARQPATLLVMPAHSTTPSSHNWPVHEYVDAIDAVRRHFREVVVCVHAACWTKGLWVTDFQSRGYRVIQGMRLGDTTSQARLQEMLSSFEYVTTNSFGSLLVYGSYYGAKVSIYGPYAEYRAEDYESEPHYANNPALLGPVLRAASEEGMREHYPELFCHPAEAVQRVDWARIEVGYEQRLSPRELRRCFGWTSAQRASKAIKAAVPTVVKQEVRRRLRRLMRRGSTAIEQLNTLLAGVAGHTNLLGERLVFQDGAAFRAEYTDIVLDQRYRFATTKRSPVIIDCSAGTGLLAMYFKAVYPGASITVIESDPRQVALLARNLEEFGLSDVKTVCGGQEEQIRPYPERDHEAGNDNSAVQKRYLHVLLQEQVDLLRLAMVDDDISALSSCADLLSSVRRIVIMYRVSAGGQSALNRILSILEVAKYRVHIRSNAPGTQPYLRGSGSPDLDCDVEIIARR